MFVGYLARGVALIQLFHKPVKLLVPLLCLADFLLALFDGLFLVQVGRFPDALCKLLFIVPHIPAHTLDNGKNGGFYLRRRDIVHCAVMGKLAVAGADKSVFNPFPLHKVVAVCQL